MLTYPFMFSGIRIVLSGSFWKGIYCCSTNYRMKMYGTCPWMK
nr:MAG TPA: hypothetical protein [Caudoviricetes sp.]